MKKVRVVTLVALVVAIAPSLTVADQTSRSHTPEKDTARSAPSGQTPRELRFSDIVLGGDLPLDLTRPERKTRWDLRGLVLGAPRVRTMVDEGGSVVIRDQGLEEGSPGVVIDDKGMPRPRPNAAREAVDSPSAPARSGMPASDPASSRIVYTDSDGGADVALWFHPEESGRAQAEDGGSQAGGSSGDRGYLPADRSPTDRASQGDTWIPGSRRVLQIDETHLGATDHLWIDVETVGIGWVHLADGPREAILQRALVLRERDGVPGYQPESLIHRWVSPQTGILAEVWGPPTANGHGRESVGGGRVLTGGGDVESLSALTKMYEDELIAPVQTGIGYGWDRGNVPISELTSQGYANAGALVSASVWDFTAGPATHTLAGTTTANNSTTINGSGVHFQTELRIHDKIALSSAPAVFAVVTNINSDTQVTVNSALGNGTTQTILRKKAEVSNTSTLVNASETCNAGKCGYSSPGAAMDRLDRYFDDPVAVAKTNAVRQRTETVGSDATHWLRAGAQNETLAGSLGVGESRFCYDPTNGGRTAVPLWRFGHHDAGGYFVQPGDSWTSNAFNCEKDIFNGVCAADSCGFLCSLWVKACSGHSGTQGGAAIKSGVLTVPSGHTFNAMLFRTVADFCVYITSGCGTAVSQVRTVVYTWQVPQLGTVVELDSAQQVADNTSFTNVAATIINFGLFPPRSIQATASTNTTVNLSWDPGLDTHRITGYRVYWDTDSGGASSYAFNSTTNPGQVSFAGTTATVSGLTPGTVYYFTVTALSTFTDPSSSVVTTYESLLYPSQVSGDPDRTYPIEVQAATTGAGCTPTAAVTNLLVHKVGDHVQLTWNPVADACAAGYRVLRSSTPTPPASFTRLADTGLGTSWTGDAAVGYFLVVARGNNGSLGP